MKEILTKNFAIAYGRVLRNIGSNRRVTIFMSTLTTYSGLMETYFVVSRCHLFRQYYIRVRVLSRVSTHILCQEYCVLYIVPCSTLTETNIRTRMNVGTRAIEARRRIWFSVNVHKCKIVFLRSM